MNSPVPCLPDPIQNMPNKNKNKNIKNQQRRSAPKRTPFLKQIQAPAVYGMVNSSTKKQKTLPLAVQRGDTAVVKNFELVTPFGTPSADFNIAAYEMNPGSATSFPWLSQIAKGYQKFRFLYFRAFYNSTVATSASGTSFIQIQYDNQDTDPTTIAGVMAGDASACGPVWFGGAVNADKAFDRTLNMDSNIFVDLDADRLPFDWYYVRLNGAGIVTHASLTGAPTGGIGTLALTDGSYVDQTALPFSVLFGSDKSLNSAGSRVSPGQLYLSYIVEFAEPVAPSLAI